MGIDCYYNPLSSPSRAVLLAAKNIGIPMTLKLIDLMSGEQMKPEFIRMNPLHQIPVLDDDGFYLNESRAILQYLGNAYSKDDALYPKEPKKRFIVDQRLLFDQGTLYSAFEATYYPAAFQGQKIEEKNLKRLEDALNHTNNYLEKTKFIAGDNLTIADFAFAASLSSMEGAGHDIYSTFPNIKRYMDLCKKVMKGYTELNQQGADQFGQFIKQALQKLSKN